MIKYFVISNRLTLDVSLFQKLKDPQVLALPRGHIVNLPIEQEVNNLNNNSRNSVTASPSQSKADKNSKERKSRQESYKKKFSSHPHMIIPHEDFLWAINQSNSVKTLFMECWMSDPYGSRPMQLNHSLKPSSFKTAKKIISEAGLFTFESKRSIRDSRESVCWMIVNLHGARRNDFWLEQSKNEANHLADTDKSLAHKANDLTLKANHLASISPQTQSQQELQNPSETSQERLSNSSKELLETLPVKNEVDDRDRDLALEGQVTSAPPQEEKPKTENESDSASSGNEEPRQENTIQRQNSQALNKKSTPLEEDYKFDWRSTQASERAVAQILAIEEQKTSQEYQTTSKEAFARIRAIFEQWKKAKLAERESKLKNDSSW